MSNIDKQALNQEKIEWLNKLADMEYCKSNPGHWLMSLKDTNMLAKLALRSVALLDELEAKDRMVAELLNIISNHTIELGWGEKPITLAELIIYREGSGSDALDAIRIAAAGKGE